MMAERLPAADPIEIECYGPAAFGLFTIPPFLPYDLRLSQVVVAIRLAGQFIVYARVVLHVAAALMHRFIRRSRILDRMLPLCRRC